MIYKIHKTRGRGPLANHAAGYAHLTYDRDDSTKILIDPINGVSIKYGFYPTSSGVTLDFTPNKNMIMSVLMHEHGHTMFANGHITYGKVVAGPGGEGYLSPYEMILLGYMSPTQVTFNNSTPYNLKDYSARDNSSGYILKVPIATGEYFLITNRGNYSKWDKVMMGDTARINTFDIFNELGSGIYIHHVNKEITMPYGNEHVQDLECADGLWSFEYDTQVRMYAWDAGHCFDNGMWNVYKRNQVIYNNDNGKDNPGYSGDDKSSGYIMWAWKGQAPLDPCTIGTERTYTNDEDYFAFDQNNGDRFDPWKMNYNEVFSPYSSPNTNTWTTVPSNQNSGIFIVLRGKETDKSYNIDILKVDGTHTLESILSATPPSRPMGIKLEYTDCVNEMRYPVIKWNQNREPDMIFTDNSIEYKKYNIYRAVESCCKSVPYNYSLLATVNVLANENQSSFIDYSFNSSCGIWATVPDNILRYYITAVDNTNWESVPSDFVTTYARKNSNEDFGFNKSDNHDKSFTLSQNYPNPFNPVTSINYTLPKDGQVTLKIYDITGREVETLVNEIKRAGYYTVQFNASHLSSGIYFYRINAGDFIQTKKMVLIK